MQLSYAGGPRQGLILEDTSRDVDDELTQPNKSRLESARTTSSSSSVRLERIVSCGDPLQRVAERASRFSRRFEPSDDHLDSREGADTRAHVRPAPAPSSGSSASLRRNLPRLVAERASFSSRRLKASSERLPGQEEHKGKRTGDRLRLVLSPRLAQDRAVSFRAGCRVGVMLENPCSVAAL